MTLKEKFKQFIYPNHIHVNEISDWADDYAIEFAEWRITTFIKNADEYTMRELLEIFKKEKGL